MPELWVTSRLSDLIDTEGFSSCKRRERLILRKTDTERALKIDSMTLVIR